MAPPSSLREIGSVPPSLSSNQTDAPGGGSRRRLADGIGIVLAVLVVGGPALLTQNGFELDFTNHLWLVFVQERSISAHLVPAYFIDAPSVGVFYPLYMFYGGTLYAATGALAALTGGHVTAAYIGATLLAASAAYGGFVWLSRQLGAQSWMAQAPAITYLASAYYITNVYGRGAWPEVVATSTLPLLVASGWKLANAQRIELLPAAMFVVSAVFFTGSHSITLLLGTLFVVAGLVVLRLVIWRPFGTPVRRLLELCALLVVSVAVNAWFLLPDLLHASQTQIANGNNITSWEATSFFNTPWMLFDPLRTVPAASTTPALFVQAPDWLLLWALTACAVLWRRADPLLRRAVLAVAVVLLALLALIMIDPVWSALPLLVRDAQFPYRLNTYVAMAVAGLVLIGVLALERIEASRRRTLLSGGLAAAISISVGLCLWQLWVPNTRGPGAYANRDHVFVSTHVTPRTWYATQDYADASEPVVPRTSGTLLIDPAKIDGNQFSTTVTPPPGAAPFVTNIAAGPYAVRVDGGVVRIGRTAAGLTVLRRARPGSGPLSLSVSPATGSIAIGRTISVLAILALSGLFVKSMVRRVRRGPRARTPLPSAR